MFNILSVLGFLSGILTAVGTLPYIYDILKKNTKPERAAWFIWTVLILIQFFSQLNKGASSSLWLSGVQAVEITLIFLLSIKYGIGGFSKKDYFALLGAGFGLIIWYFTQEAAFALLITIGIDALGGILTVEKTYHHPETETPILWICSLIAGIFASISVGKLDFILLSYPLYIVALTSSILTAVVLGYRRKK